MDEVQIFEEAEKNQRFLDERFKELETKYPNQFVAISGSALVGAGETPDAVFEVLKEKGLDNSKVLIEFIPLAGSILVL